MAPTPAQRPCPGCLDDVIQLKVSDQGATREDEAPEVLESLEDAGHAHLRHVAPVRQPEGLEVAEAATGLADLTGDELEDDVGEVLVAEQGEAGEEGAVPDEVDGHLQHWNRSDQGKLGDLGLLRYSRVVTIVPCSDYLWAAETQGHLVGLGGEALGPVGQEETGYKCLQAGAGLEKLGESLGDDNYPALLTQQLLRHFQILHLKTFFFAQLIFLIVVEFKILKVSQIYCKVTLEMPDPGSEHDP